MCCALCKMRNQSVWNIVSVLVYGLICECRIEFSIEWICFRITAAIPAQQRECPPQCGKCPSFGGNVITEWECPSVIRREHTHSIENSILHLKQSFLQLTQEVKRILGEFAGEKVNFRGCLEYFGAFRRS